MADLLAVAGVVVFVAICALYVKGCDVIIGRDDDVAVGDAGSAPALEEAAAMTEAAR